MLCPIARAHVFVLDGRDRGTEHGPSASLPLPLPATWRDNQRNSSSSFQGFRDDSETTLPPNHRKPAPCVTPTIGTMHLPLLHRSLRGRDGAVKARTQDGHALLAIDSRYSRARHSIHSFGTVHTLYFWVAPPDMCGPGHALTSCSTHTCTETAR